MSNQPAYTLQEDFDEGATPPGIREQLHLNRIAVDHAESELLAQAAHPARWERRGLLRRLSRREPG
jgi:hypothetical protein